MRICKVCGYEYKENETMEICPECGSTSDIPKLIPKSVKPKYVFQANGSGIIITKVNPAEDDTILEIPEMLGGKKVATLGKYTFSRLEHIEIIIIPDSVTTIESNCFRDNAKLKKVQLPKNITRIAPMTFENCAELESINIPENVKFIYSNAFKGCKKLKEVILPEGLEDIGENSFFDCSSLESIHFPESVKKSDKGSFRGCTSLKEIVFNKKLTMITAEMFMECKSLEQIRFPLNIRSIGASAFRGCKKLNKVTLPISVSVVDRCAFVDCRSLEKVIVLNDNIQISREAFGEYSERKENKYESVFPVHKLDGSPDYRYNMVNRMVTKKVVDVKTNNSKTIFYCNPESKIGKELRRSSGFTVEDIE